VHQSDIPYALLIPSPAFQNKLDTFLTGLSSIIPKSQVVGGIASTVSSLSRPRLYQYSSEVAEGGGSLDNSTFANGCVGVVMRGDLEVDTLFAPGAKAVGDIYRVMAADGSTILAVQAEESDDGDNTPSSSPKRSTTPRPPLAEANYLLKNVLSDDEAVFMKKTLLIGVKQMPTTSNGNKSDNPYTVYEVASAGAKDGSATLPLGSVEFKGGERVRFFVRDGTYAKEEVNDLWKSYSEEAAKSTNQESQSHPSGCLMLPTSDRGTKMYGGKAGFESAVVAKYLPTVPSISGFFTNGNIAPGKEIGKTKSKIHGSGTSYAIFRSSEFCVVVLILYSRSCIRLVLFFILTHDDFSFCPSSQSRLDLRLILSKEKKKEKRT
jgi:small ligand-binding sensory domain FIST